MTERRKEIRRANDCPAEKCTAIAGVARQIKWMGASFLTMLSIIMVVVVFMMKSSNSTAETVRQDIADFIKTHTQILLVDAERMGELLAQNKMTIHGLQNTTEIQIKILERLSKLEAQHDKQDNRPH